MSAKKIETTAELPPNGTEASMKLRATHVNWAVPTRQSLLSRLRDWNDQDSWRDFFDTYWSLIYATATKAGLSDAEAQDVVQETILGVMKSMPDFKYDAKNGSFKGWLMRLTSWRIVDHIRKRKSGPDGEAITRLAESDQELLEQMLDPESLKLEAIWEEEWERNLLQAALERVKKRVDPKLFQIFDSHVCQNWPVARVVRAYGVNPGKVYLTKLRISRMLKQEIEYLRTKPV